MLTRESVRASYGSSRAGVTMLELLVATTIGGIVLGLVVTIAMRQQRLYADLGEAAAMSGQLRDAESILPIDLRGAAVASGDLRAGEARDTSLELRGTIATGVVCDTASGSTLLLAPAGAGASALAGVLATLQAGDTAWLFVPADSVDDWQPHRITSTTSAPRGSCAPLGPALDSASRAAPRTALALEGLASAASAIGRPLRVTRPLRYSLYHAGDGLWYLGQRDWNPVTAKFNTIQPVSGPFLSPAARGLVFRYLDSVGTAIPTPVTDPRNVAIIRVELRGQSRNFERALGAAGPAARHGDSVMISIRLHNGR